MSQSLLRHGLQARWILVTSLCFLLPAGALAQSDRGSISGTVTDSAGAVVPAAAVRAVQTATNIVRDVETTSTGKYAIPELPAGVYTLTITKAGFSTYSQTGIRVGVGQISTIDVALRIGDTTQTVLVTGDAPLLKTETPELSTTVTTEEITNLPLDFANSVRNPISFAKIVPGSVVSDNSGWPSISQNGLQTFTEEIRIDGARVIQPSPGVFGQLHPSVDAIQEFSVQTSTFNAEYGQVGGATYNFTLKSGTNQVHGAAYEYLRNEFFNARNKNLASTDPKSLQRRHDFGGTFGGPIYIPRVYNGHDKTFFYASWESYFSRNHDVKFYNVPRDEWRNGDLSSLLQPAILGTDVLGRPIQQGQIYDPLSTRTVTVAGASYVVRDPFPNNRIPQDRFSQVAKNILKYVPSATTPGIDRNNLLGITGHPSLDYRIFTLKLDHNFSVKSHLSIAYNYSWDHDINGGDPFGVASAQRDQTTFSHNVTINHDFTFTPTSLNHLTLGIVNFDNPDGAAFQGNDLASKLGLKGTFLPGYFPRVSFGLTDIGANQLKHNYNTIPNASDSFTKVMGAHTLKAGAEWHRSLANMFGGNGGFGTLGFSANQTALPYQATNSSIYSKVGSPFASFLLGTVNSAGLNSPLSVSYRSTDWGFYLQDDYKVNSRLTVNYGLRYDLHQPLSEKYDRIASFDPNAPNSAAGGHLGALAFLGTGAGRVGRHSFYDTDYKDIGPRIGAAYKLNKNTVLRGGWGIVFGQLEINVFDPIQSTGVASVTTSYPSIDPATQFLFQLDSGFPSVDKVPPILDPTLLNNRAINYFSPESGKLPKIYNWNITVQHQFGSNLMLEAAYVGNRGTRLISGYSKSLNQNSFSVLSLGDTLLKKINGPEDAAAYGIPYPYPGFTGTVAQALRPYPQYKDIVDPRATVGESSYNALQIRAVKRLSHGLEGLVSYTLSKNITTVDDAFGWGGFGLIGSVDAKKLSLERGLAVDTEGGTGGDRTHNLVVSFSYELPFSHTGTNKAVKAIAGGWRVSGILQYGSGAALPVSPFYPNNLSSVIFNSEGRYDRVASVPIRNGVSDPKPGVSYLFNPGAFKDPAPFTVGNAARTYEDLRGFPLYNEDVTVGRAFPIREHMRFEVRADAFNIFNRTRYNNPSTNVYDTPRIQNGRAVGYGSFFGVANIERQMQLSARFIF